mgnify:CR=1 FL=1
MTRRIARKIWLRRVFSCGCVLRPFRYKWRTLQSMASKLGLVRRGGEWEDLDDPS